MFVLNVLNVCRVRWIPSTSSSSSSPPPLMLLSDTSLDTFCELNSIYSNAFILPFRNFPFAKNPTDRLIYICIYYILGRGDGHPLAHSALRLDSSFCFNNPHQKHKHLTTTAPKMTMTARNSTPNTTTTTTNPIRLTNHPQLGHEITNPRRGARPPVVSLLCVLHH